MQLTDIFAINTGKNEATLVHIIKLKDNVLTHERYKLCSASEPTVSRLSASVNGDFISIKFISLKQDLYIVCAEPKFLYLFDLSLTFMGKSECSKKMAYVNKVFILSLYDKEKKTDSSKVCDFSDKKELNQLNCDNYNFVCINDIQKKNNALISAEELRRSVEYQTFSSSISRQKIFDDFRALFNSREIIKHKKKSELNVKLTCLLNLEKNSNTEETCINNYTVLGTYLFLKFEDSSSMIVSVPEFDSVEINLDRYFYNGDKELIVNSDIYLFTECNSDEIWRYSIRNERSWLRKMWSQIKIPTFSDNYVNLKKIRPNSLNELKTDFPNSKDTYVQKNHNELKFGNLELNLSNCRWFFFNAEKNGVLAETINAKIDKRPISVSKTIVLSVCELLALNCFIDDNKIINHTSTEYVDFWLSNTSQFSIKPIVWFQTQSGHIFVVDIQKMSLTFMTQAPINNQFLVDSYSLFNLICYDHIEGKLTRNCTNYIVRKNCILVGYNEKYVFLQNENLEMIFVDCSNNS